MCIYFHSLHSMHNTSFNWTDGIVQFVSGILVLLRASIERYVKKETLMTETILLHLKWQQYVHICKDGMSAGGWHDTKQLTLWPKYVGWDHPVTGVARGSLCRTHLPAFSFFFGLMAFLLQCPPPLNLRPKIQSFPCTPTAFFPTVLKHFLCPLSYILHICISHMSEWPANKTQH